MRRAARGLARLGERHRLAMRPPARRRPAAADHLAVLHEDGADRRVRPSGAEPARPEPDRRREEAPVELLSHPS